MAVWFDEAGLSEFLGGMTGMLRDDDRIRRVDRSRFSTAVDASSGLIGGACDAQMKVIGMRRMRLQHLLRTGYESGEFWILSAIFEQQRSQFW